VPLPFITQWKENIAVNFWVIIHPFPWATPSLLLEGEKSLNKFGELEWRK
jgi:hypothetical protein